MRVPYDNSDFLCRRNPKSRFREWIGLLPKSYLSLMMGSTKDLELLEDQRLIQEVRAAADSLEKDYDALSQLFQSQPNVFPAEQYNKQEYLWARFMIDSRCWSLKGERLCVPGADFFNYGVSEQDQSNPDSDLLGHFFSDTHKLGRADGRTEANRCSFRRMIQMWYR